MSKTIADRVENLEKAVDFIAGFVRDYGGGVHYTEVNEILNPPDPDKFMVCDTCRVKPGSPPLCKGCLHNRSLIEKLTK